MPLIDTSSLNVVERLPGWKGRYFHSDKIQAGKGLGSQISESCAFVKSDMSMVAAEGRKRHVLGR
ncbi:MAG TPA: hypothetical protein VFR84_06620 [Candidatus Angelobacter sp.]|nr:hypothetical protein [Candidatus Angelobacter sp.]